MKRTLEVSIASLSFNLQDGSTLILHNLSFMVRGSKYKLVIMDNSLLPTKWACNRVGTPEIFVPDLSVLSEEELFQYATQSEALLDLDIIKGIQLCYNDTKSEWMIGTFHCKTVEY